jgi:hypothetical protein
MRRAVALAYNPAALVLAPNTPTSPRLAFRPLWFPDEPKAPNGRFGCSMYKPFSFNASSSSKPYPTRKPSLRF